MPTQNNQQFYIQSLLALKQAGEKSPYGSDERKLYSTKANSLRELLKTQFGMMNIDADYGAGVSLANTPGGGKIDWNVLANAADILGTSQAGSTRSAFDRALGEYLTRNLPVWQKQQATTPSSALTATETPVMGGGSAAASIASGQPLTASSVNSGMQASQATATQQAKGAGTWNMGTAGGITPNRLDNVAPGFNPDGTPVGGAGGNVYGDFIKSSYFKNNDFDGYFLSKNPNLNLPTVTDPTTGRVTIDWGNVEKMKLVPESVVVAYGNATGLWNTLQGLSKEKDTFNAIDIEKNPAFKEQMNVFSIEMESLQKQFNLNVDAQLAGLKGSQDANKAALEYELNTIKREIGASNWRSRQSLAASGMAFSGMLGYLYGQNEAKGMDATIRATAISAAELKAIGEQMAILDGSKLSYASDLERMYGAKRSAYRASLIDPTNTRLQEIGQLIDQGIADFETTMGTIAPAAELERRETVATQETATGKAVQGLNDDQLKALDKGYRITGMDENGIYSYSPILSGKELADFTAEGWSFNEDGTLAEGYEPTAPQIATWLADGILYDPETRTLSQVMSPKDVADFGIEGYTVDPKTGAVLGYEPTPQQIGDWLSKGVRYDPKTKTFSKIVPATPAGGGGGTTPPESVYDPKGDLSILSNSGATAAEKQRAALNLTAGKGALTDTNFTAFMQGGRMATDADGNVKFLSPTETLPRGFTETGMVSGLLTLDPSQALQIANLIEDPVRQMAVMVILSMKGRAGDPAKSWFDPMNQLIESNADQYEFSSEEVGQLEKMLLSYFGTQPGPGA
jgi:hypothetical protein